jgi:putative flavoprotein involved in K+ transport
VNRIQSAHHDAIIIGAGQSGLAAAYHLAQQGTDFVVLERAARVGDGWRERYDSLRLYSPAKADALPGMAFPLPGHAFPTGRQMGDYLESYAKRFELPVRTGVEVEALEAVTDRAGGYLVRTAGRAFRAPQVVIAGGYYRKPHVPNFSAEFDPGIRQLHSGEYRGPSQLADGTVLVVGRSHSGADLALEAVRNGHRTILSGRSHGQLPFSVDSRTGRLAWPVIKFLASNVLTLGTPIGRKVAPEVRKSGAPLLRVRAVELDRAGVESTEARVVGAKDGKPTLDGGRELDVANVLWCTGFRPDYGWIDLPIFDEHDWPQQYRGVVDSAPGVYFLGLPFQYAFTSMLVAGAGRDAAYVTARMASRAASNLPSYMGPRMLPS